MKRNFFILIVILFCLTSCFLKTDESQNSLKICSWNVENLFNSTDDGNEYDEYLSSSGWNETQYKVRLKKVVTVLGYSDLKDADIIVLNEVENESVVEDILSCTELRKRGFYYYACSGEKNGAIKTAVLSRLPIEKSVVHSIEDQRPVLEVDFDFNGNSVYLLAVHAKSNLGTESENIRQREILGNVIEEVVSLIKSRDSKCSIVVAGDFNEEVSDSNVIENPNRWTVFWDENINTDIEGSYYYDEQWHTYDNIALLKDSLLKVEEGNVVCNGILLDIDGKPDGWKRYLLSGVSDHLPVWTRLIL